jgi:holo-[acyl-carrier protein] synthase
VISNIQEVRARGARTIVLAEEGDDEVEPYADVFIELPRRPRCCSRWWPPCRCSCSPARWPRCSATTSTSRATSPSRSPSSDGVDVCSVARITTACSRPGFTDRVFTLAEQHGSEQTLAGRFAAKEALAKALGAPAGLRWSDCEVLSDETGRPDLVVTGTVAERIDELGGSRLHVSISHDAGVAVAMVVVEG